MEREKKKAVEQFMTNITNAAKNKVDFRIRSYDRELQGQPCVNLQRQRCINLQRQRCINL
jgi:hypothetical protein